jgi:hypothetical protein
VQDCNAMNNPSRPTQRLGVKDFDGTGAQANIAEYT